MSGSVNGPLKQLENVFPNVDPESLEVVLNMVGGDVDKAAQFIFDIMQQQEGDDEDMGEDEGAGPQPSGRGPLNPDYVSMNEASVPPAIRRVVRQSSWFAQLPYIASDANLQELLPKLQRVYPGEFHCALSFEPAFVAELIRYGYLTMAERLGPNLHVLLPKMHSKRCILQWGDGHVEKNVCKRCKRYEISMDTCFERVLEGCVKQHGEAWLYKPLRECFATIHHAGGIRGVTLHSFELWEGELLVAGEVGTAVGGCYTALSGFKSDAHPSSGTVQLCATADILRRAGFSFWDFGMELPYKLRIGAKSVEREWFLEKLNVIKDLTNVDLQPFKARVNCSAYIRRGGNMPAGAAMKEDESVAAVEGSAEPPGPSSPSSGQLSKSQKKKLAKIEKKRSQKLQRLALARESQPPLEKKGKVDHSPPAPQPPTPPPPPSAV